MSTLPAYFSPEREIVLEKKEVARKSGSAATCDMTITEDPENQWSPGTMAKRSR
jgi:hypothetical protein